MSVFIKEEMGNTALNFSYKDPVDGSVSKNQGYIFKYSDGSNMPLKLLFLRKDKSAF